VPRAALEALEPPRQRNLLRYLLRAVGLDAPSARKLEELREALLSSSAESHTEIRWPGAEARVYRAALYLSRPLPPASPAGFTARLGLDRPWTGPEGHVELVRARDGRGLPQSWASEGFTLRFRSGSERFQPQGRAHHHSLKDLFQERGVVPWMRARVPLIYRGEDLVAIGDLWQSTAAAAAAASEPRWRVQWTEHPAVHAPAQQ
jgi:tRNA(Ile)-lysidine synthase